jgi:hypothetical protein
VNVTTPHTTRANSRTTGDLPQGKFVHIEHARPVLLPGPAGTWAARRGTELLGRLGLLGSPASFRWAPTFHLVATASGREVPSVASHRRDRRFYRGRRPHFHLSLTR